MNAGAAAAAAARAAALREEEERLTRYEPSDLDEWEFKIVRATTRKFKDPEFLRQLLEEEARAGWEMLEKFDDQRIRFKRRTEHRAQDRHREIDPYRAHVGTNESTIALIIVFALLGVLALGLVASMIFK